MNHFHVHELPPLRKASKLAQRKSYVLLNNGDGDNGSPILPLSGKPRIYAEGISEEVVGQHGEPIQRPDELEVAILHLSTPYEKRRERTCLTILRILCTNLVLA